MSIREMISYLGIVIISFPNLCEAPTQKPQKLNARGAVKRPMYSDWTACHLSTYWVGEDKWGSSTRSGIPLDDNKISCAVWIGRRSLIPMWKTITINGKKKQVPDITYIDIRCGKKLVERVPITDVFIDSKYAMRLDCSRELKRQLTGTRGGLHTDAWFKLSTKGEKDVR